MNFDRGPGERKGMMNVDTDDYRHQLRKMSNDMNISIVDIARKLDCSDKKIRNAQYSGRIRVDIYRKLEKLSGNKFQPKIIAPCTAGEIKQYLDTINEFNFNTKQMAQEFFNYYNSSRNWHCKDGQIITRDNLKFVINRNYERKVVRDTELDAFKVSNKKNPDQKIKNSQLPLNLVYEVDEAKQIEETRREIQEIRKRIEDDIRALDNKLFELQHNQRNSYIKQLQEIVKKIDKEEIKKHFFQ